MTSTQLTPAQHAILAKAINTSGGKIEWFPDNIKGGARTKVLEGLFNKALVTRDNTNWFVSAEGYDAMGRERPVPAPLVTDPELDEIYRDLERRRQLAARTLAERPRDLDRPRERRLPGRFRKARLRRGTTPSQFFAGAGSRLPGSRRKPGHRCRPLSPVILGGPSRGSCQAARTQPCGSAPVRKHPDPLVSRMFDAMREGVPRRAFAYW